VDSFQLLNGGGRLVEHGEPVLRLASGIALSAPTHRQARQALIAASPAPGTAALEAEAAPLVRLPLRL